MKKVLLLVTAVFAFSVGAMPTRDEQKQAASVVAELMNPLVADFKAKKKTAVEVGETAMAYAKEANTEGAKFLLLKGAIWYFAQAKEDAKAVAADRSHLCHRIVHAVPGVVARYAGAAFARYYREPPLRKGQRVFYMRPVYHLQRVWRRLYAGKPLCLKRVEQRDFTR